MNKNNNRFEQHDAYRAYDEFETSYPHDTFEVPARRGLLDGLGDIWQYDELAQTVGQEGQASIAFAGLDGAGKRMLINRLQGWVLNWQKRDEQLLPSGLDDASFVVDRYGSFVLVDLPNPQRLDLHSAETLFHATGDPALVVYLLDATRGVTQADHRWLALLRSATRPLLVVLNKVDVEKGSGPQERKISAADASQQLGMPVLPISAYRGLNVEQKLLPAMIDAVPRLAVSLGREISGVRRYAARRVVRQTTMMTALLGAQPVPGLELPLLALTHVGLMMRIGATYGHAPSGGISREAVVTVAAVMLSQYGMQVAVKFVPLFGPIIGAVLSALTTLLLGELSIRYFEREMKLPLPPVRRWRQGVQMRIRHWRKKKVAHVK